MSKEYPSRSKLPPWIRYLCMAFGLVNIVVVITCTVIGKENLDMVVSALLVGSAWFAFGAYGGFPLVNTVADWHPPATPDEVTESHRRGLLVMRRRKWMIWATVPSMLAVAPLLFPLFMKADQPELIVLVLGVPLAIIIFRYLLSRCPRWFFHQIYESSSDASSY